MYVYIYTHIHIHVHIYIHTHTCIHMYMRHKCTHAFCRYGLYVRACTQRYYDSYMKRDTCSEFKTRLFFPCICTLHHTQAHIKKDTKTQIKIPTRTATHSPSLRLRGKIKKASFCTFVHTNKDISTHIRETKMHTQTDTTKGF